MDKFKPLQLVGNTVWFIADLHFSHNNILHMRPFSNIEDMNKTLIYNWNQLVNSNDYVFILGDLSFAGKRKTFYLVSQLKGKKFLIAGNHDYNLLDLYSDPLLMEGIDLYKEIKLGNDHIILSHYPIEDWNGRYKGSYHLHGHTHKNITNPIKYRYNVGVDVNGYQPITWETIKYKLRS